MRRARCCGCETRNVRHREDSGCARTLRVGGQLSDEGLHLLHHLLLPLSLRRAPRLHHHLALRLGGARDGGRAGQVRAPRARRHGGTRLAHDLRQPSAPTGTARRRPLLPRRHRLAVHDGGGGGRGGGGGGGGSGGRGGGGPGRLRGGRPAAQVLGVAVGTARVLLLQLLLLVVMQLLRLEQSLGDVVRVVLPRLVRRHAAPPSGGLPPPTPSPSSSRALRRGGTAGGGGGLGPGGPSLELGLALPRPGAGVGLSPGPGAALGGTALRPRRQPAVHAARVLLPGRQRLPVRSRCAAPPERGPLHGGLRSRHAADLAADHSLAVQEAGVLRLAGVLSALLTGRTPALGAVSAAVLWTGQTGLWVKLLVQGSRLRKIWGRYHGGRRPSSDDGLHSPTVISPLALHKPSIMKRYHRR